MGARRQDRRKKWRAAAKSFVEVWLGRLLVKQAEQVCHCGHQEPNMGVSSVLGCT